MNHLKAVFTICMLLTALGVCAQVEISGSVYDAETGEPLSFCHVVLSDGFSGTITNEDGGYTLFAESMADSATFSFVGFANLTMSLADLNSQPDVRLKPLSIDLGELFIYADDSYLYSLIAECADFMKSKPLQEAKAHFHLATTVNEVPNEMIECYYNAQVKGAYIKQFELKNGRAGLPREGDKFFFNLQTSHALSMFDLINGAEKYPISPLELNTRKMRKAFTMIRLPTYSDTNTVHIEFSARKNKASHFRGELWIDKESKALLKAILKTDNTDRYPFYSIGDKTRIRDFSFDIVMTFRNTPELQILEHMSYGYEFELTHHNNPKVSEDWRVKSKSLVHFYDFEDKFFLPFFKYDKGFSDYRMISFFPHDSIFWTQNHGARPSVDQLAQLKFFKNEGFLLNFKDDFKAFPDQDRHGVFASNNILWSEKDRVKFGRNASDDAPKLAEFLSDMINVAVQIFLDVNAEGDSWRFNSATVLDVFDSYNYIGETPLRNCFVNIYFDLAEMARREMLEELISGPQTEESITEIYEKTVIEMQQTLELYSKEAQQGQKFEELQKWNDIVKDALGIDNIGLYGESLATQN